LANGKVFISGRALNRKGCGTGKRIHEGDAGCGRRETVTTRAVVETGRTSKQGFDWDKIVGFAKTAWPSLSFRRDEQPVALQQDAPSKGWSTLDEELPLRRKPRVVILGSGWGAVSFIKALPKEACSKYEIILVSPRNYFLYTPLLPAIATGTMEERSIVEPIRHILRGKGQYFEAMCTKVDHKNNTVIACYPDDAGNETACFKIPYDMLLFSVGAKNSTFGIKGVAENCHFFKTVEDAHRLRRHVAECFERASLPQTMQEEREKLLSFVIVGGGPTGVEVAAELHDMVSEDLSHLYPELIPYTSIKIIDGHDYVLSAYHPRISHYTGEELQREGVDLVMNSRVKAIAPGVVTVEKTNGGREVSNIRFGTCVWAAGISKNPLVAQLQEVLEGQNHPRSILTDGYMRVKGSNGRIWAIGDAATIEQERALAHADELFARAANGGDGRLTIPELKNVLIKASSQFPQFKEFASFFEMRSKCPLAPLLEKAFPNNGSSKEQTEAPTEILRDLANEDGISREEFNELLQKMDGTLRALPATAQVARQEGEYLASLFSCQTIRPGAKLGDKVKPFKYFHKGQLAYVGEDRAVIDAPVVGPLWGFGAGLVWKSFETYSQISLRNKILVGLDWARTKVFGRDISRV